MSYHPKAGMYRDASGTARFTEPGTTETGSSKRWYSGEVVRRVLNRDGEVVKRNRQATTVFAREGDVARFLMARCPDPWPGEANGEVRTNVYFGPMGEEEGL